jgi:hypothetical protein
MILKIRCMCSRTEKERGGCLPGEKRALVLFFSLHVIGEKVRSEGKY